MSASTDSLRREVLDIQPHNWRTGLSAAYRRWRKAHPKTLEEMQAYLNEAYSKHIDAHLAYARLHARVGQEHHDRALPAAAAAQGYGSGAAAQG